LQKFNCTIIVSTLYVTSKQLIFAASLVSLFRHTVQALLELDQVFPAVLSAENAVERDRTWAPALQTLGRAQLGLGEVQMALRSFEKAVHLDPANDEVSKIDVKCVQRISVAAHCIQPGTCDTFISHCAN
jgi:tetratricopeptide (TPR) repeat protein